ncbi:putative long-chain-alcohol O-fatty-acyltransferase 3 [Raphanus sativus]|nr:putative long-chain-alcohol O-fatty-acyltransferase 3 [Raphanus sativus]
MEGELKNFIKVWVSTIISVSYCYYLSTRINLLFYDYSLFFQFVFCSFSFLCFFSSVHFSGASAFFFTWLANFKLILFSFDKGPLYPLPKLSPGLVFASLGCDLEPQFNEPYLATSLQDFWGRRWTSMVTAISGQLFTTLCSDRSMEMSSDNARFWRFWRLSWSPVQFTS